MLPDDYNPIESNPLVHRLQSAENSINFIQREHASTLANLHEEIAKWQDKCSGECLVARVHPTASLLLSRFNISVGHPRRNGDPHERR